MKSIPKDRWPDWIKHRLKDKKGFEVKESKGHYYLYEYKNTWNKKLKQSRKRIKYLCVLRQQSNRIREHGHIALLYSLLSKHKILESLKKNFPDDWKEILVFSLNRIISPSPLKRMGSWMDKTTLGKYLDLDKISGKQLSKTLAKIGTDTKNQSAFMKELIKKGELLLYDGSLIYSSSEYNKLLEISYKKGGPFLPKANITLLFSKNRNIPIHFKLFFGSVHEIRTIEKIIEEIKEKNIMFIADKGYYKNKLYEDMRKANIKFVMPLPRDDKRINYKKTCSNVFEYHKRIIKYTSYESKPYYVYHFEDQYLKYIETTQYYKLKLLGRNLKFHEERAGKIALLSNEKLIPKEAYLIWKSRDAIEKVFNVLQNNLETDHPYVSDEDVFRGYVFASFISLITYYLVLNILKKAEINDKVSVDDVLFEFSKIMVEEARFPSFTEIPSRVEKLAKKLNVKDIVTKIWES